MTFPPYMRLSQELPRKSLKKRFQKTTIKVTNLAQSPHANQNPTQGAQRCHLQRMRKIVKGRKRNSRKITRVHCAVLVFKIMDKTSFGSAATYVRNGSTVSASRSLQPKQSTSSSTSAPLAAQAAREPKLDCVADLTADAPKTER
uniref:Uncharacterized protein n=1 Tax=Arundo donax TaxID=35708 RepID=A0A0A8XP75_ARUDO